MIYFLAGIAVDLLSTFYTVSVSKGRPLDAAATSFLIPICHLYLLSGIIAEGMPVASVIAYASGNALGAFAVMRWSQMKENKKEDVSF